MKRKPCLAFLLIAAVAAAFLILPATANACSVCMGDAGSKQGPAINAAIFLMLGFLGCMFAAFGSFALYLARRASSPVPPHAELGAADDLEDPQTT